MEEKLREMRLACDRLAQAMEPYRDASDKMFAARECMFFAKAWMGKMLGAMGTASPYPNDGKREGIKDIEPTAERYTWADGETYAELEDSYVKILDRMRTEIVLIVKDVEGFAAKSSRKAELMKESAYVNLCEARFYLGFELERIRELNELDEQEQETGDQS